MSTLSNISMRTRIAIILFELFHSSSFYSILAISNSHVSQFQSSSFNHTRRFCQQLSPRSEQRMKTTVNLAVHTLSTTKKQPCMNYSAALLILGTVVLKSTNFMITSQQLSNRSFLQSQKSIILKPVEIHETRCTFKSDFYFSN